MKKEKKEEVICNEREYKRTGDEILDVQVIEKTKNKKFIPQKENPIIKAMTKFCMMKEALASCQIEGIGKDITIEDLYLEDLK